MGGGHQQMGGVQRFISNSVLLEYEILDYGVGGRPGKGGARLWRSLQPMPLCWKFILEIIQIF